MSLLNEGSSRTDQNWTQDCQSIAEPSAQGVQSGRIVDQGVVLCRAASGEKEVAISEKKVAIRLKVVAMNKKMLAFTTKKVAISQKKNLLPRTPRTPSFSYSLFLTRPTNLLQEISYESLTDTTECTLHGWSRCMSSSALPRLPAMIWHQPSSCP